jgi:hypothetical protein
MATRELKLFADLNQGRLVEGFNSTLQATLPTFFFGDTIPISLRVLTPNENNPANPWGEVDLTEKTIRVSIGRRGQSPTSGEYEILYNDDSNGPINLNATAQQIEANLNANTEISALGGVTVTKSENGLIRIFWNDYGSKPALFTAETFGLVPTSTAIFREAIEGDASTKSVTVLRLRTVGATTANLEDELPASAANISVVRSGVLGNPLTKARCFIGNLGGNIDGDSFYIGVVTFTFRDSPSVDTDIQTGANAEEEIANIMAAINAHPDVLVTASDAYTDTVFLEAKTGGISGNDIDVIVVSASLQFVNAENESVTKLYGGLDYVASVGEIQSLQFLVEPYAGTYALTFDNEKTGSLEYNALAEEIQEALEALPNIPAGEVLVSGEFPRYFINFDPALGNVTTLTADVSALISPTGRAGILSTDTAGILELLDATGQANGHLEVEIFDNGDNAAWTLLQADCLIMEDIISN